MKAVKHNPFLLLLALLLLIGCSQKGQDYFNALVVEVQEGAFLVECIDESSGETTDSPLIVPKNTVSSAALPEIAAGDTIRVVYHGVNETDFPPEIETVYAIYLGDNSGNVIPNE